MAKQPVNHVGLYGKEVACYYCGARIQVVPPGGAPIEMVLAAAKAFEKIHKGCKETPGSPTKKLEASPGEWERGLFVGSSSATIFAAMTGRPPVGVDRDRIGSVPQDPDDFSRCYRLLRVMPEWSGRLQEVSEKHAAWKPLVDNWDRLTAMFEQHDPKMFDVMKALTKPAMN